MYNTHHRHADLECKYGPKWYDFIYKSEGKDLWTILLYVVVIVIGIMVWDLKRAEAVYHVYTCADGLTGAGASYDCTDDIFTLASGGGASSYTDTGGTVFTIADGTTYYISYNATRDGIGPYDGRFRFDGDSGNTDNSWLWVSGDNVDVEIPDTTGIGDNGHILIYASTQGSIQNLCISDTLGECGGTPDPDPATTTATTTVQTVDNPSQNVFNGMLLFMLSMFFAIFLARKH